MYAVTMNGQIIGYVRSVAEAIRAANTNERKWPEIACRAERVHPFDPHGPYRIRVYGGLMANETQSTANGLTIPEVMRHYEEATRRAACVEVYDNRDQRVPIVRVIRQYVAMTRED